MEGPGAACERSSGRDWAGEAARLVARVAERGEPEALDALATLAAEWLAADGAAAPSATESRQRLVAARRLGERFADARILHVGEPDVGAALAAGGASVRSELDHPARVLDATLRHGTACVRFAVHRPGVAEAADLVVVETAGGTPLVPLDRMIGSLAPSGRIAFLGDGPPGAGATLRADGGVTVSAPLATEDRAPRDGETGAALYRLDLLESERTALAHLELTSRCNLRCVYCAVSQPDYVGTDLDVALLDPVLETLRRRRVELVVVNGHGETTMVEGWHRYCNVLLDAGLALSLTTNFARELTPEEAETLARFRDIEVSCDTVDPVLFRQLRRSADFLIILLNMAKVQAAALGMGCRGPRFAWSVVVSDQTVLGLPETVAFALAIGVRAFDFCSLTEYPAVRGGLPVRHISRLAPPDRAAARAALDAAIDTVRSGGATFFCHPGLLGDEERDGGVFRSDGTVAGRRFSPAPDAGTTRDCVDPWKFAMVKSNGDVLPCCWHRPVGTLRDGVTLDAVLDGDAIRRLRERLLAGDLDENCRSCPARSWTGRAELAGKVVRYLEGGAADGR